MNEQIKQRITQLNNGEVPIGYEKTDFGIFPCDWVTNKKLKDLGSFGKGKGLPGDKMTTEGVPCVGYGDIYMKYNHFHFEKAQTFVDEETAAESQPIYKGTLLFTGTGETADEIGKCVCYNGDETIYAGGDIITFVGDKVNPLFLAYQQYQEFSLRKKASFGQGHSVVHIQRENLEKLNVAYPKSTEEQSKIAETLMKWDEAIELRDKYIEVLKKRQKALMQKLLTPCETWPQYRLGDICDIRTGNKNTQDNVPTGAYPFFVRSSQVERINSYTYDGEAILIPGDGNIGEIFHYINGKFDYHQRVYKISDSKTVEMKYLYYYLKQNLKRRVISLSAKATVDSLRMDMLTDMTIAVCPKHNDVVNVLCLLDNEIEINDSIINQIKQQRKTLQQYLLNGIVRV